MKGILIKKLLNWLNKEIELFILALENDEERFLERLEKD